ncbi:MAG: hypothetical protein P8J33_12245, partial [Pirellulaceae bacterium]|nr:hypothetical protein [Pirellulaceae bacterium]
THPEGFEGDESRGTNAGEIAKRSVAPLLASVPYGAEDFDTEIDWLALSTQGSSVPRPASSPAP